MPQPGSRRTFAALAVSSALMASTALAASGGSVSARPQTLMGAHSVHVSATRVRLAAALGNGDAFLDLVSGDLRTASVPVMSSLAFMAAPDRDDLVELQVTLEVDEPCGDSSEYRIELLGVQRVRLARNPVVTLRAPTWRWGRTGRVPMNPVVGAQSFLRDLVRFATQRFITDYKTVNK